MADDKFPSTSGGLAVWRSGWTSHSATLSGRVAAPISRAVLHIHSKKNGPDNPTSQLLPIMSNKCCSGDGEGRKDKGGGGGKMVCDKVVCVCVKDGV